MRTTADAVAAVAHYLPRWLETQLAERRCPGAQVAVRVDGELLFSAAVGVSDVETGTELTTDHVFRVASHSKTVTATALMQLLEGKRLRLDDALADHVPAYAGTPVADLTLRELLGHCGGVLRDGIDSDFWQLGGPFPSTPQVHELGGELKRYEPMQYWKYTNIGYAMLGEVVTAVTGQSWGDYVREHVFARLGLERTTPDLEPDRLYAGAHSRIVPSLGRRVVVDQVPTADFAAATGVCSTAEEISAFMSALKIGSGKLLSDRSKRYMQQPETLIVRDGDEVGRYGLGMFHWQIGSRRTVGHSGGWPGHITKTVLDPADGLCVSVLTNCVDGPADPLLRGVVALIDIARKDRGAWQREVSPEVLASFEGRYEGLWGTSDLVSLGNRLVDITPQAPDPTPACTELDVVSETLLRIEDQDANGGNGEDTVVERDESGKVVRMTSTGVSVWPTEQYEKWLGTHLSPWQR